MVIPPSSFHCRGYAISREEKPNIAGVVQIFDIIVTH